MKVETVERGDAECVVYKDVAGETFDVLFEDDSDAQRFIELAQLWPALSALEMLIAIEQREGKSHLWKEFEAAVFEKRVRDPAPTRTSQSSPAVSGAQSDEFLRSFEWLRVRMIVLERDGAKCCTCGRTRRDGIIINVDHIKPRKRYPELALDPKNLQVLCNECNLGKGNKFETDWRR